jgi:hypothetical protein
MIYLEELFHREYLSSVYDIPRKAPSQRRSFMIRPEELFHREDLSSVYIVYPDQRSSSKRYISSLYDMPRGALSQRRSLIDI